MEHRERSHRLNSKIVISEPQEKDGTENYRRTPETVTMEIHFEPSIFLIKDIQQLITGYEQATKRIGSQISGLT